MDKSFIRLFLEQTQFPREAQTELLRCVDAIASAGQEEAMDQAVSFYRAHQFDAKLAAPMVEEVAQKSGFSPYTAWTLLLIQTAIPVKEDFKNQGVPEYVFWDTFSDLRYKALECREIYGVWGTFVAFWYPIFFTNRLVKLGRLEYESCVFEEDAPLRCGNVVINPGDPVKGVHIPSSGEPFHRDARLDSYRKAYRFFQDELHGGPLVCVCHSWLLYPPYKTLLSPSSNIRDFMEDFHIFGQDTEDTFHDAWRLFGRDYQKPTAELPENTSMQRAYKKYLLEGNKAGEGKGILLFDGEKILFPNRP